MTTREDHMDRPAECGHKKEVYSYRYGKILWWCKECYDGLRLLDAHQETTDFGGYGNGRV